MAESLDRSSSSDATASPVLACIALGSNLSSPAGDRAATIASAVRAIEALPGVTLKAASEPIETEPVGPPGQGPYLNAAVSVLTTLGPRELLSALLEIEHAHGRERRERWGARTLDCDLILFGDAVIHEPGLTVPHPEMANRRFVLEPIASIEPDFIVPRDGRTVGALLAALYDRP
jgi:2-amino-4-hydroxy-6-hydroxymethyldihydropteridine diphosphokinase